MVVFIPMKKALAPPVQALWTRLFQDLFTFENELRLYHWSTSSYARHKASDELYSFLHEWMDRFVEALAGGTPEGTLRRLPPAMGVNLQCWTEDTAAGRVDAFAKSLAGLELPPALASLRDDLDVVLLRTLYLFRLK